MNERYGQLTVLGETKLPDKAGRYFKYFLIKCDCGVEKFTSKSGVINGRTVSCGCKKKAHITNNLSSVTHGHAFSGKPSKTYRIWNHMKTRCLNPKSPNYPDYGGRGITISEEWMIFENFLRDMGECPVNHSIDRIDVNGNYCKENCKWSTNKEQANNRRSCKLLTFEGKTLNHQQWAESLGFKYGTIIAKRLSWGWSLEKTLTTRKSN
jgi:hypothetical protein